ASFDHFIRKGKQRRRNLTSQRPSGLEVNDKFEFCWLQDGQIGRLLASQDATDIDADLTVAVCNARTVAHQTTGDDMVTELENSRHFEARRQFSQSIALAAEERIGADDEPIDAFVSNGCENFVEFALGAGF